MFDKGCLDIKNVHDNRTILPDTINIHEHRAPTDESIKILHEMEQKARESIIAQVAEDRPNDFHFDIIITEIANVACIDRKFGLYFRINVNGKLYEHKIMVNGDTSLMHDIMIVGGGRHKIIDYSCAAQRFFLLQFSIIIAKILFNINGKAMDNLMTMVGKTGATNLNIEDLNRQLEDWEKYNIASLKENE